MSDLTMLAFGAGVQSTALLLLILDKDPRLVDVVDALPSLGVFANPGSESLATYGHLAQMLLLAAEWGFDLRVAVSPRKWVQPPRLITGILSPRTTASGKRRFSTIPAYVVAKGGSTAILNRNCTADYKVNVTAAEIRKALGVDRVLAPTTVDVWLGISTDEIQRMKPELRIRWQRRIFPLIEMGWSRQDCLAYLRERGFASVPRSACVFCPFHSDDEWKRLHRAGGADWQEAVKLDRALRNLDGAGGITGTPYLHRSCTPLESLPFLRQQELWPDAYANECEGYCGI